MISYRYLILIVAVLFVIPVQGITTSQFHKFFGSFQGSFNHYRDVDCKEEYDEYSNPSKHTRNSAFGLLSCILDHATEIQKAEMGLVSIFLGLLPAMLLFLAPTASEISLLAWRRPVLALLLAFSVSLLNSIFRTLTLKPISY